MVKIYEFLCSKTYSTYSNPFEPSATSRQAARNARICETRLLSSDIARTFLMIYFTCLSRYSPHYSDVIIGAMASQVTNPTLEYAMVYVVFRRWSKKKFKAPRHWPLCGAGNSMATGEFPAQMASNAENVSIWWRHHVKNMCIFFWNRRSMSGLRELWQVCYSIPLQVQTSHIFALTDWNAANMVYNNAVISQL